MKSTLRFSILAIVCHVLILSGCANPVVEQEHSGFLSDYSGLEQVDSSTYIYLNEKLAGYSSFIIEPLVILYDRDPVNPEFSDEELDDLNDYFVKTMTRILTEDDTYQVVTEPGPGVARYRIGITDLDATNGALNVTIYTKVTGAGLGGIATETEMVDSVTGEQLSAAIRWGSGSRVLQAGFTRAGDAKILINRWIKDTRKAMDEMHPVSD